MEHAPYIRSLVLLWELWYASHVTKVISWKARARSPAMAETPACPNGVTAAQSVSVSTFFTVYGEYMLVSKVCEGLRLVMEKYIFKQLFKKSPLESLWI